MDSVFVWWIGENEEDRELMEHVRHELARAFGCPVFLWESPERPTHAYDPKRKQWQTAPILRWLVEQGPDGGKVLGVTDRDLFIPILTYVFGEAQLSGRAAVVSLARLVDDVALRGRPLFLGRAAKEAIHEVGHAFGLLHCHVEGCVMGRSPAVREVDEKTTRLCDECRAVLEAPPDGRG
jgi:archaemetzincin